MKIRKAIKNRKKQNDGGGKMRKLLGIGLLIISLIILGTGTAKATVVTLVTELINTQNEIVRVTATASDEVTSGYWTYTYNVYNENFDDLMYGFQVGNAYGYTIEEVFTPPGWSFGSLGDRFIWTTPYPWQPGYNSDYPLKKGETLTFVMRTPTSPSSIPGLQYAEAQDGVDCIGKTLSPVPEPTSLLLLGFGLLGLAAFGGLRRRKA